MAEKAENIIELKHITKVYSDNGFKAVDDFNLEVKRGEFVTFLGPSGCGKTTTLRMIAGFELPSSGEILLDGRDIAHLPANKRPINTVFQRYALFPHMNIYENIAFGLKLKKLPKEEIRKKVKHVLDMVDLEGFEDRKISTLSGGQQQRIAIARALATSPKILLCDEATSALDPQTTASILELLQEINRKFNITIVIITHQMSVVRKICSHVAIMKSGEIVETGSVSEIFSHPKSDVARELIRKDEGDDISRAESSGNTKDLIQSGRKVRIVFSENSAFQPVIANMILKFREPVNILRADTRNIGGVAKGEMILEFAGDSRQAEEMQNYLKTCGIELEEVTDDVE